MAPFDGDMTLIMFSFTGKKQNSKLICNAMSTGCKQDQGAITALVTPPPHECWQAHKAFHKAGKTLKLSSQEEEEDSEECCVQIEV